MSDEKMNQSETIDTDTFLYMIKESNNDDDTYNCIFFFFQMVRARVAHDVVFSVRVNF